MTHIPTIREQLALLEESLEELDAVVASLIEGDLDTCCGGACQPEPTGHDRIAEALDEALDGLAARATSGSPDSVQAAEAILRYAQHRDYLHRDAVGDQKSW